jgi:cysteine-rich repeat protein
MESTKTLRFLCLCILAAAFAGCADTAKATMCETTGVICPSGMHCAAAEPVCIIDVNLCGNARVDPGEVCDDGNTKDGDGCSADCKSNETCGNGILDDHASTPEVCDDGNTADGDGCSHDCLSL